MKTITITVKEKIATAPQDALIVCGNSDIKASFAFDDQWDNVGTKTAVFVTSDGAAYYAELKDNCCDVPVLCSTAYVKIGVISAAVITSTSATVPCKASITDEVGSEAKLNRNQYEALCGIIEDRFPSGGNAGEMLIKQSNADYDVAWGVSDAYLKEGDVYTKKQVYDMVAAKAPKRSLITSAGTTETLSDVKDYYLKNVSTVCFVCENAPSTDAYIMLTTATEGDVSISFENLTSYSGPDPATAGNGETWEFDILHGRCIGRKWA